MIPLLGFAQQNMIFTTDRGLSSSLINELYQDGNNMIWIATEYGLNRYDGAKFVTYLHDNGNDHSLSHNYVSVVYGDSRGRMFIGTYNGIQLYDPATDSFSERACREDGTLFDCHISSIMERRNGEVWVAGSELCSLSVDKDDHLTVKPLNAPFATNAVRFMMEDNMRNVWVVVNDNGIYRMDAEGKTFHYNKKDVELGVGNVFEDIHGDIYAAKLDGGLLFYDRKSEDFVRASLVGENLPVKSICQPNQNELYLGTDGKGVKVYNIQTHAITSLTMDNSYFDTSTFKVHSILKDNGGNLWLAIYQKGIMIIPAQQNNFRYIGAKSLNNNVIGSNCITSIMRDSEGTLWVGTDNDGLYAVNGGLSSSRHFVPNDLPGSIPSTVFGLYEDSHHNIWCGSYTKGLGRIDRKSGRCTYLNDLVDSDGSRVQRVYDVVEDKMQRLWIATMGSGLFYYDLNSGETVYEEKANSSTDKYKWISCLLCSTNNKLYVGTYDGLRCINLASPNFDGEEILQRHIIFCIYEDCDGNVWVGHSDGLTELDRRGGMKSYTVADGLPSGAVYAIEGDDRGNVWMSTNSGLSRFDRSMHRFINFYVDDGLRESEFSKNASMADADGTLWFGGMNSIVYFKPQEIVNPAKKWNVRVTGFYLHNEPVHKGTLSGGYEVVDTAVFDATDFRLSHNDNSFSVEFATVELGAPERVDYLYSMNDGAWVKLPKGINRVSFSELPPGDYTLRIKANDCMVESEAVTIKIHIMPAWWSTWWAIFIYVVLFFAIVGWIVLQLVHRYRTRQEMLQHIHAEQINEAKLQFFINISHEIRTPMSLIISPLQKLMTTDSDDARQKTYRVMYRNSQRILRLINQLMDIRKIDKGQMTLAFRETEIVGFINDLKDTFASSADRKHIALSFTHEGLERLAVWVDPVNFDKIVMNLLSNALKFTPDGGSINVNLAVKSVELHEGELTNCAELSVKDSGIGIPESGMEHIFERFYQIRNSQNSVGGGTGVGLHLTHSLVELHHGRISVANNVGEPGCCFTVVIPLGREHLRDDELAPDDAPVEKRVVEQLVAPLDVPEEEEEERGRTRTKYRVLIVEDDEEIRRYISSELSADYKISESSNGKEALQAVFDNRPDIIISDVMMPEMDGITLCRKIKQNITLNCIPVILLTAKTREEDNMEGLESGADAYMTKPFNIELLKKTVQNLLKSCERMKNSYSGKQLQTEQIDKKEMRSADDRLMERVMKVINDNISNPELTVDEVAASVGISRVHLHRKLKELTGQTTRDYIRNVRLKMAAELLSQKRYSIAEVSDLTGFANPNSFSVSFKELYGVSPSLYMDQHLSVKDDPGLRAG
jgi:signal transduction histidine kinase/ligand-binding sensor domain-containing protein/DNA-binding response OmpR family regulator